jgi:hypothetical protein
MFSKVKLIIMSGVLVVAGLLAPLPVMAAETPNLLEVADSDEFRGQGQPTTLFEGTDAIIPKVINIMLFIVGILAVVMLIYGGIRYTVSGGKPESVTAAKNTIMYAIVGLVVAILGYAVVHWVVGNIGEDTSSSDVV